MIAMEIKKVDCCTEIKGATPLCSTSYMSQSLGLLTREKARRWFEEIRRLDFHLAKELEKCAEDCSRNRSRLPDHHVVRLKAHLRSQGLKTSYDLRNIEVFHGYVFYTNPDHGQFIQESHNPHAYYGFAKSTALGYPHQHHKSDAFNFIMEGEGIFLGDPREKNRFPHFYHGLPFYRDMELQIPMGMTHGHLVKTGSTVWFFAIQECGFGPGRACEGDFHPALSYDLKSFGPDYISDQKSHPASETKFRPLVEPGAALELLSGD
jgi:hypothetical protein